MNRFLLLTAGLTGIMGIAYAGTPEQISIQTLLAQAASYNLHEVTLHGVTKHLAILPPVPKFSDDGGCVLYGTGTFTLDDGTGSLPVEISGSCSPSVLDTLPKDGKMVRMTAIIYALTTDLPVRIRAKATKIDVLHAE